MWFHKSAIRPPPEPLGPEVALPPFPWVPYVVGKPIVWMGQTLLGVGDLDREVCVPASLGSLMRGGGHATFINLWFNLLLNLLRVYP